jgi:hypothetical protein
MSETAPAITTRTLDLVLTGGLSALAMGLLLAWAVAFDGSLEFVNGDWIALLILVNAPHFMASYRLLYVSREQIVENRWSAIYVPLALLGVLGWAALGHHSQWIVSNLIFASSIYLAWHYTGQAWGMVSAFSRVMGIEFTNLERLCIRSGMRVLLALHVLFALSGRLPPKEWIAPGAYIQIYGTTFKIVVALAAVSLLAGAGAFFSARARGQSIPLRVVLPWLALYFWYPFWYYVPGGFIWVQLSHALQYLAFPMRVEINRFDPAQERSGVDQIKHAIVVYGGLVLCGAMVLHGPPLATYAFGEGWYSSNTARLLFTGFVSCIAIHHYFIDGAVWKLSNPKVRRELLSHLGSGRLSRELDLPS